MTNDDANEHVATHDAATCATTHANVASPRKFNGSFLATGEGGSGIGQIAVFAGLTQAQAADILGVSMSTADNDWTYAKNFLRLEMSGESQIQGD